MEDTADGLQGVMTGDSERLQNRQAVPAPADSLAIKALGHLADDLSRGIAQLGGRAFIMRATSAFNSRRPAAEVLGNLLYARDLVGDSPDLQLYAEAFRTIDAVTLETLDTLEINPALFPRVLTGAGLAKITRPATTSRTRTEMLQDVLAAVVTVKAGGNAGSGFFVGNDGLVLTNAHVVEGAARLSVHTSVGDSFLATPVKISNAHDLALLKVSAKPSTSLLLGNSGDVSVGTDIVAIGSPLGLSGTVTKGIVSAIRNVDGITLLQIDAAINPGNSGGPLLTEAGEVIGINTMKLKGEGAELLGFAIAIDEAKKVFSEYLR